MRPRRIRRRDRVRLIAAAIVGASTGASIAPDARADCDVPASTCIDSDILWPHAGPSTFFALASGDTTAKGRFGFGLFTSIQRKPIVLKTAAEGPAGSVDIPAIGTQVNTSFAFSYGITERLEAALVAPVTFYQNGSGATRATGPTTEVPSNAVRDVRLGIAYAFLPLPRVAKARGVGILGRFDVSLPTGDRDTFAGDRGLVFIPSFALDERLGRFVFGAQFGARLRKNTTLVGATVGAQAFVGGGVGLVVDHEETVTITGEAFGLPTFVADRGAPAQWLVGAKWAPLWAGDFAMHGGAGGALRFRGEGAIGEATWRAVLDLRYVPLAYDTDGDGVLDRDDRCEGEREDRDGYEDLDGCPDPDDDKDGILDVNDRCREEPENKNGLEDDDGCPEPDADDDGIRDDRDKCPGRPEDKNGYEDTDGCPEGGAPPLPAVLCADGTSSKPGEKCDVDHDGITDELDGCPMLAEDKDGIADDDGCPERDADEDGVGDEVDKCPTEPETIDGKDDSDGCPEPGAKSTVTFAAGAIEVDKPVRFTPNSAVVPKAMATQIAMIAQRLGGLVDRGVDRIVVESWGDNAGENAANETLAKKRADAVKAELVAAGIPDSLIKTNPGDLADPPAKPKANYLVTVRAKRKEPLKKPVLGAPPTTEGP
jgi:OOP family OmpA-OmpF porin